MSSFGLDTILPMTADKFSVVRMVGGARVQAVSDR
jgi:hypothetical protein